MELKYEKIYAPGTDVGLKVTKGHFATNHAHTNYYIDLTTIKSRVSEAQEIARALVHMYLYDMVVDTIVCMEGTEVIGTPTRPFISSSPNSTATARSCSRIISVPC